MLMVMIEIMFVELLSFSLCKTTNKYVCEICTKSILMRALGGRYWVVITWKYLWVKVNICHKLV